MVQPGGSGSTESRRRRPFDRQCDWKRQRGPAPRACPTEPLYSTRAVPPRRRTPPPSRGHETPGSWNRCLACRGCDRANRRTRRHSARRRTVVRSPRWAGVVQPPGTCGRQLGDEHGAFSAGPRRAAGDGTPILPEARGQLQSRPIVNPSRGREWIEDRQTLIQRTSVRRAASANACASPCNRKACVEVVDDDDVHRPRQPVAGSNSNGLQLGCRARLKSAQVQCHFATISGKVRHQPDPRWRVLASPAHFDGRSAVDANRV